MRRAAELVPAWTQTLSKNPTQWSVGAAPLYVSRASGAHVWDVDGNRFIDLPMALGAVILGHAWPAVNEEIARQLADGITYTLPHPIEIEVAERIVDRVPGAERVRFAKSGSDVNSAAIRIARAVTGKDGVLVSGYHGWHDWYIGSTTRNRGIPREVAQLTRTFDFTDIKSLEEAIARQGATAAVVVEPATDIEPAPGHLEAIAACARAAGALLVFDEVITGFRVAPGGAQERYGVTADLVTFGKALGNGMPISAIAGPATFLDELSEIFFSGTHGGEVLSLAAARATLDELTPDVYAALERKGERLRRGVQRAIDDADVGDWVTIGGTPHRTVVGVTEPEPSERGLLARTFLQQEMIKQSVLYNGNNFVCAAHTDADIDEVVDAYAGALAGLGEVIRTGRLEAALDGEPLQAPFRPVS